MAIPSTAAILDTWERAIGQGMVERGLTLLALADPETDPRSLAELSIGERDRRLLALRETCFGPRMTGLVSCVRCREELEIELTTPELRAATAPRASDLIVQGNDYLLRLRLPDSRDLLSSARAPDDDAVRLLLRACIVAASIDGESVAPEALPPHLVAEAARCLAAADPLADLRLAVTCASCGHSWQVLFDIVPFLWTELDAWARRMLREVHVLASAYGWTEREILSLAPTRRGQYLRMLNA
jgi:hypothetical protein